MNRPEKKSLREELEDRISRWGDSPEQLRKLLGDSEDLLMRIPRLIQEGHSGVEVCQTAQRIIEARLSGVEPITKE